MGPYFRLIQSRLHPHPLPPEIPIWAVYLIPHYRRKYTASSRPASAARSSLRKDQSCTRFLPRYSVTRMQTGGEAGRDQRGDYGNWEAQGVQVGPERSWGGGAGVAGSGARQEERALGRRGVTHLTLAPGCLPAPSTLPHPAELSQLTTPLAPKACWVFYPYTPLQDSTSPGR